MKRWQVRAVTGHDDHGQQIGTAWTQAGAWKAARRRWERSTLVQAHYDCGNLRRVGCPIPSCTFGGWLEVRRAGDDRSLSEVLTEEVNRGR